MSKGNFVGLGIRVVYDRCYLGEKVVGGVEVVSLGDKEVV